MIVLGVWTSFGGSLGNCRCACLDRVVFVCCVCVFWLADSTKKVALIASKFSMLQIPHTARRTRGTENAGVALIAFDTRDAAEVLLFLLF